MKKQNILLLFSLFFLQNGFGQVLFSPVQHTIRQVDTYEFSMAGDLDGDGLDELVILGTPSSGISAFHIFDVASDGELSKIQTINLTFTSFQHSLEDADNDGDLDIFMYNFNNGILFYENLGNATFSTTSSVFYPPNPFGDGVLGFHFLILTQTEIKIF